MSQNQPNAEDLAPDVVLALRAALPALAEATVIAVTDEVAEYRISSVGAQTVQTIQAAIEVALDGFLDIVSSETERAGSGPHRGALEGAYALGRGEARAGRTMEALLAAYRIGARVAWREQSAVMVLAGTSAQTIAQLAELTFSYIDELSGASAAGHRDELESSGRVREQLRERLARALLEGEPVDQLQQRAERAGWPIPETITVVVLAAAHLGHVVRLVDPLTLRLAGEFAPDLDSDEVAVLLIPDVAPQRAALTAALRGRSAVIGPTRSWADADRSYHRVRRSLAALPTPQEAPLDTDDHLIALTLTADQDALADLRARVLAPLDDIRPATADRLAETLRSWLLHLGRRKDVAADLHLHPQTIRYRMAQIETLFGVRLQDPEEVLALTIALAHPAELPSPTSPVEQSSRRERS